MCATHETLINKMTITDYAGIHGMSSFPFSPTHETYLNVAVEYNSKKCATITFTHSPSFAKQLSNEGIKVNAVALYAMKSQDTDNHKFEGLPSISE
jgi:hypothetical protein